MSRVTQLLHCVIICGIESTDKASSLPFNKHKFEPQILDVHPPDAETPPLIEQFCLPAGVEITSADATATPDFFTFILTSSDGTRSFGASLTFLDALEGGHQKATKSISVLSHYPLYAAFREIVTYLHDVVVCGGSRIPFQRHLDYVIKDVPLPVPGGPKVQVTLRNRTVVLRRPALNTMSLLDVPLYTVFRHMKIETVVLTLKHVLLEHKVLLVSSDMESLGYVAETLCSLISPFRFDHVYIPLLPNYQHFVDYLAAPVPFLCGVHTTFHAVRNHPGDVSVVDLDTGVIHSAIDNLPLLPLSPRRRLKKKLRELLDPFDLTKGPPPPTFPTMKIRMAFFQFFAEWLHDYRDYAQGGEGLEFSFDAERMIATKPAEDREFFNMFTKSQIFHSFVLESLNPSPSNRSVMIQFDETIKQCKKTQSGFGLLAKFAPKRFLADVSASLEKIQSLFVGENSVEVVDASKRPTDRTIVIHEPVPSDPNGPRYNYTCVPRLKDVVERVQLSQTMSFYVPQGDAIDAERAWARVLRALQKMTEDGQTNQTSSIPEVYVEINAPLRSPKSRQSPGFPNDLTLSPIVFPTHTSCPKCNKEMALFTPGSINNLGLQIQCDGCPAKFVPMVSVLRRGEEARDGGDVIEGTKVVWKGYFLSVHQMCKEISMLIRRDIVPCGTFPAEHPTTFWNLVLYLRRADHPLSYFLPGIQWSGVLGDQ